jgi:hypothetical protein
VTEDKCSRLMIDGLTFTQCEKASTHEINGISFCGSHAGEVDESIFYWADGPTLNYSELPAIVHAYLCDKCWLPKLDGKNSALTIAQKNLCEVGFKLFVEAIKKITVLIEKYETVTVILSDDQELILHK